MLMVSTLAWAESISKRLALMAVLLFLSSLSKFGKDNLRKRSVEICNGGSSCAQTLPAPNSDTTKTPIRDDVRNAAQSTVKSVGAFMQDGDKNIKNAFYHDLSMKRTY